MARRSRWRVAALLLIPAVVLALLGAGAVLTVLTQQGITPRALAPYVEKRSSGHNSIIVGTGQWAAFIMTRLDRGPAGPRALALLDGRAETSTVPAGKVRLVASGDELRRAIAAALPGEVITILPGRYTIAGPAIAVARPGTEAEPIVVRAVQAGSVELALGIGEGFSVSAPHWRFENLTLRGVCRFHRYCEHAFHVTGNAHHFAAVNNTIIDYNAHFKINGDRRGFPDHGLIDGNTLRNDSVRITASPVTPIDLVAASHWTIRRNAISDFVKGEGDRISYGAFAKGAGSGNVFEQNVVLCEARLRGVPGQRVGLSLGGGGSGRPYCRDGKCITEQDQGVIRSNLIASCSDDGIYLNNAAASKIIHNTLLDTGGIQVRFAGSSADIEGNIVDGDIRVRHGALARAVDNLTTSIAQQYLGHHPQRGWFMDVAAMDLRWRDAAPRRAAAAAAPPDLCGVARPARPAYGAFEDIQACK